MEPLGLALTLALIFLALAVAAAWGARYVQRSLERWRRQERSPTLDGLQQEAVEPALAESVQKFRRPHLVQTIGLALAMALAGAAAAGLSACGSSTSGEEIETLIQDNLSPGSTAEEIFAFLDSHDIVHGPIEQAGPASTVLADAGVPPSTKVIGAIVRGTSKGLLTRTDIQIFFLLDDEEKLKDYLIREVVTGP